MTEQSRENIRNRLSAPVTAFLNGTASGNSQVFMDTRWGRDIRLTALEEYFAASGRRCRQVMIDGGFSTEDKALVCRGETGDWLAEPLLPDSNRYSMNRMMIAP